MGTEKRGAIFERYFVSMGGGGNERVFPAVAADRQTHRHTDGAFRFSV